MEVAAQRNEAEARVRAEKQAAKDAEHQAVMDVIRPLVDIVSEVAEAYPERVEFRVEHCSVHVALKASMDPRWQCGYVRPEKACLTITTDTKHSGVMMSGRRADSLSKKAMGGSSLIDLSEATAVLIDVLAHAVR